MRFLHSPEELVDSLVSGLALIVATAVDELCGAYPIHHTVRILQRRSQEVHAT